MKTCSLKPNHVMQSLYYDPVVSGKKATCESYCVNLKLNVLLRCKEVGCMSSKEKLRQEWREEDVGVARTG